MSLRLILQQFRIRDLLAQYGAAVAVAAISFALTAAIARRIGPEQFGLYATALAIGAILGIFLDFGFKQIIQREAARPELPYSFRRLQGTSIRNILTVAVLFVAGGALMFNAHVLLAVSIALCFSGVAFTQLISAGLRGQKYFVQDAWHQAASRVISAVAILAVLLFWPDVTIIIAAWGLGTIAWAIYAFSTFSRPEAATALPAIYRHAAPLFMIDLLIVIHFRIDLIVMQGFGVDQFFIGNFSAALRIVELLIFLTFPIRSMLLTQMRQENLAVFRTYLLMRCLVAMAIALSLAMVIAVFAPLIIDLVFDAGYGQAADLLRIMVWLLVPSFVLAVIYETSVAMNNETAYRMAAAVIVLVNLVSLTLIVQWGNHLHIAPLKVGLEISFCVLAFSLTFRQTNRTH